MPNLYRLNSTTMETKNQGLHDREDQQRRHDPREGTEEVSEIGASTRDTSGHDMAEENRDERRHHQDFGNRKYEAFRNHSSADDQPVVDTGA